MQYMLLIYGNEARMQSASKSDSDQIMAAYGLTAAQAEYAAWVRSVAVTLEGIEPVHGAVNRPLVEALGRAGHKVLIPLPDTISVSGEALIVPAAASEFVSDNLADFGASIEAFRARVDGGQQ